MSDEIGHHCGIALIRLRKPLSHFAEHRGSPLWGFNQLFLLMEKQHNRGQDGAGIGSMKLNAPAGEAFMFRERSIPNFWRATETLSGFAGRRLSLSRVPRYREVAFRLWRGDSHRAS